MTTGESFGFAFFGVDQQVLLSGWRVSRGLPLRANRKVRAAAAPETRLLDDLPHAICAESERLLQRFVLPASHEGIDPTDVA